MTRFVLFPLSVAIGIATCFNSFFYKTGPLKAFQILVDNTTSRLNQTIMFDDVCPAIELQLRKDGFGQLVEPATGRLLNLSFVTDAGRAYDGSPIFHAVYKSRWHGVRLLAYFSGGKLRLDEFCDGGSFNCKYLRPDQAAAFDSKHAEHLDKDAPATLFEEKPAFRTRENIRPGIEPAAPVNRAPSDKANIVQPVVLKQAISAQKELAVKVSMPAVETVASDPFEQITVPAKVQPWLGHWNGDFMSLNIGFSGGKFYVGKSEAKLNGSELVFLKEGTFGRIVWVKLNFSDGLIFAKEENQYGEVVRSEVLKR